MSFNKTTDSNIYCINWSVIHNSLSQENIGGDFSEFGKDIYFHKSQRDNTVNNMVILVRNRFREEKKQDFFRVNKNEDLKVEKATRRLVCFSK